MDTLQVFSFLICGLISCEDIANDPSHSPSAPVAPYYQEDSSQYYPDYEYPSHPSYPEASFSSTLERQGLEIALGAPLVITAFVAALLGGFLSPMISEGLSRLGEYEIQWPEVKRKIPGIVNTTEDESRAVVSWSWIKALEKLNQALELEGPRAKRISGEKFNKFLKS